MPLRDPKNPIQDFLAFLVIHLIAICIRFQCYLTQAISNPIQFRYMESNQYSSFGHIGMGFFPEHTRIQMKGNNW